MKKFQKALDLLIVHFCRIALSLLVSVSLLYLLSFIVETEFVQGIFFGIIYWEMCKFSKQKISLN